MPVKTNQERIKEYLVGEKGYLKSDLSNGKVIMLSGKWGSGKTHFWQNQITEDLKTSLKKEDKGYSYISLYGKSSIVEIENDIFGQVYSDAIGGENIVSKTASTFTKLTKRYGGFSSILDFSKLAESAEVDAQNYMNNSAFKRLENGGLICFDDFERKSKNIDLNDLFGFITQLTINFKCKVVIILNDDVFEGEEKNIFSNVKEKTVSKFLKYEPSIEELFNSIFDEKKYESLSSYNNDISDSFTKTKLLNARIYIQVLDNLLEYKIQNNIYYFVFANINFIINHTIIDFDSIGKNVLLPKDMKLFNEYSNLDSYLYHAIEDSKRYDVDFIHLLNEYIDKDKKSTSEEKALYRRLIRDNQPTFYSIVYFHKFIKEYVINIDVKELNRINNFIETGILIDE